MEALNFFHIYLIDYTIGLVVQWHNGYSLIVLYAGL